VKTRIRFGFVPKRNAPSPPARVDVGCIKEIDAHLQCLAEKRTRGSLIQRPRLRQAGRLSVTHTIQAEARNSVQVALLAGVSQKSPFHRDGREGIGPAGIERLRWDALADQKKIASRPGFLFFQIRGLFKRVRSPTYWSSVGAPDVLTVSSRLYGRPRTRH
jgi:hypothetical protein